MTDIAGSLQNLDVFANVPADLAAGIIADAPVQQGTAGDAITIRPVDYFVLLDGEARLLTTGGKAGAPAKIMARLRSTSGSPPDWLYALMPGQSIELGRESSYVILDGDRIDAALAEIQQVIPEQPATSKAELVASPTGDAPSDMKKMTDWLRCSPVFAKMSLFAVVECALALQPIDAGANWDIVREGSEGNFFYVIASGRAEVWRSDSLDDRPAEKVAELGPGDSFGEEALLQDAYRNATVRMTEPGKIWRLEKSQFDELVRDSLLQEVDAATAAAEFADGKAQLIDCRYDIEHEMTRIPGSTLIPLNVIREGAAQLDKAGRYLVYCRSGKRSKAAAFLMQRMGLDARSIKGGITQWPGAIESGG